MPFCMICDPGNESKTTYFVVKQFEVNLKVDKSYEMSPGDFINVLQKNKSLSYMAF